MERIAMSQEERDWLDWLKRVRDGHVTQKFAAEKMGITDRWVRSLLAEMKVKGDAVVIHGLRGQPSNRRLGEEIRARTMKIVKTPDWHDFGPTFAAEQLAKRHQIQVSKETLRKWMMAEGIWESKLRNKEVHERRLRRSHSGELVQWDTSDQVPILPRSILRTKSDAPLRPLLNRQYNTVRRCELMRSRRARTLYVLAMIAGAGAWWNAAAQNRRRPAPEVAEAQSTLRIDTNLVLVPVSVCDPNNRPVTGLEREHFKIFDDRVEQTVTHFSMDDEPVAVGLVFDISGSMGPKLRVARLAAAQFFKSANPEDEFFLVEFNESPRLVTPLTANYEEIQNQLTFAQSKGRTALLDAIMLAMHEMKKSHKTRKALLILSDGADNSSRYSEVEVRKRVRESDVLIYAIGIFEAAGARRTTEEAYGPGLLNDITEQTGGRHFPADASELPDIAAKIGIEMRNRYILGYSPTDAQRDGRFHRVEVRLTAPRGLPKLSARWRTGYFAPAD